MGKKQERPPADIETDQFGAEEQTKIVEMIISHIDADKQAMAQWLADRRKDIQHYEAEKPSILEGLSKRSWQSDRNLGICPAVCDMYQAVLLSTCWNPDTIYFKATETNDVDNKDNLTRFTKWGMGESEANAFPEVDDYIHNKIVQGFSMFFVHWKTWEEYVDKRMKNKDNDKYHIKTKKQRFEKGVFENIDNLEDILIPNFGKHVQKLHHIGRVLHLVADDLKEAADRKIYMNVNDKLIEQLKTTVLSDMSSKATDDEKKQQLGLVDVADEKISAYPLDIIEWYGPWKKNGRRERYRFTIDPFTRTFLAGKPLRKIPGIGRTGKFPFVGGPLIRRPGLLRGKSLPKLIANIVNAINNAFNQKTDNQTVTNMPFGFFNPDEGWTKQVYELEPGMAYPVSGSPKEAVYFPNLQRSQAWAESDIRILMEFLERATGAASFFLQSQKGVSGTATRDVLIDRKSETRFSLWVRRIQVELAEVITMWVQMYQEAASKKLGQRVLGEDGKQLIRDLSVESLRGNYDAHITPNIIGGSQTFERELALWGIEAFTQCPWTQPQANPRGNWQVWADAAKAMGYTDVERYLGPQPKQELGKGKEVEEEWSRFIQGEDFDPPEGATGLALEHYLGHLTQKEEKYNELDEEYRPIFDKHLFKTSVNLANFFKQQQQEKMANNLAIREIQNREMGI